MSSCDRQAGANIALPVRTQNHTFNKKVVCFFFIGSCVCVPVCQSYGTSRSVLLSSCPRFCMYLHWPSWTGCPVRWMLSTVSWASSNSHCTTNTGPRRNRGCTAGQTLDDTHLPLSLSSVLRRSSGGGLCGWVTHFSTWGRLYTQRNSSTPLPHEPVCSSLAPSRPSTCTTAKCHHSSTSVLLGPPSFHPHVLSVVRLSYLMPLFMASVGAQLMVSRQSVNLYCLLSRNHPESARPLTCTPWWPCDSSCSATRSTFRRTPVPPALLTGRVGSECAPEPLSLVKHIHTVQKGGHTHTHAHMQPELTCFLPGAGPWRCPDLLSAARSPPP